MLVGSEGHKQKEGDPETLPPNSPEYKYNEYLKGVILVLTER